MIISSDGHVNLKQLEEELKYIRIYRKWLESDKKSFSNNSTQVEQLTRRDGDRYY